MSELRLDGKVAIVTGAGRGLGRAYALLLAARGASVVVNDLGAELDGHGSDASFAHQVAEEIRAAGGKAAADTGSVASQDDMNRLARQALDEFGSIDIVINNAGNFMLPRPFLESTRESFQSHWDIHLMGAVNLCRAVWPHMLQQRYGRIINVGSHTGYHGHDGRFEYAAVKGAMHGFTLSLAMEAGRNGIAANVLAPGAGTRPVKSWEKSGAFDQPAFAPELAAPTAVWLAHESCPANGMAFCAMSGNTSRIVVGETKGYQSRHPTPEAIREHEAAVIETGDTSASNLLFPNGAVERGGQLVMAFNALPE